MTETWIVNASPLIVLAKIGRLDLLKQLAVAILIPSAVRMEVLAGPPDDPARRALEANWGCELCVGSPPAEILEWGLGAGETEVIAAALERGSIRVVLDDAQARACARTLGLPVIGTLGVVLRAKVQSLIPLATPVLADLQMAGLRVDPAVLAEALKSVGEGSA